MSGIGVAFRAGDETLTPLRWKFDVLENALACSHGLESKFGRSKVTFRKSETEPLVSELRDGSRFLSENRGNRFVQRFRIGVPVQFDQAALAARTSVAGNYRQNTIKHCFSIGIATQVMVIDGKLLKDIDIARIEFEAPLEIPDRIFPATLPAVDVATQFENKGLIWQQLTRKNERSAGTIIIEVGTIQMIGIGQMRLSRVGSQPAGGLHRV